MEIQLALAAVKLSIARPLIKNWNKKGLGPQVIQRFLPKGKKHKKNAYRLYLPIKPTRQKIVVPPPISLALAQKGYSVDDYINGIAVDSTGKRRMRIGKLIKDQQLLKEFMNDPQRAAHKDEFTCVISCHPYDVLSMSTGRRWDMTSCMRLDQPGKSRGGINQHLVKNDIAEGTLVAYAISPEDTNINKPHARLLIKPFFSDSGAILFRVETSVYGTPIPGFKETVSKWLRRVNAGVSSGKYSLAEGLYDDGVGKSVIHADWKNTPDKVAALQSMVQASGDEQALTELLITDKRWLKVYLENAPEVYAKAAGSQGPEAEAAYQISALYGRQKGRLSARVFGKAIDDNVSDDVMHELVDVLAPLEWRAELVDAAPRLKEWAHEMYSFDTSDGSGEDYVFVLNKIAYYDPRWLSLIQNEIPPSSMMAVFRSFLQGFYKWTPELQKSKYAGAVQLRQQVGFLCAMLNEAENRSLRADRKVLTFLINKFKPDLYFSEETKSFLRNGRFNSVLSRYCTENGQSLLCAVDKSWPAEGPELISYANYNLILREDVFTSIANMKLVDCDEMLFSKMTDAYVASRMGASEWFSEYPWAKTFVERIARGPSEDMYRAQAMLNKLQKANDEMDAIFDELEGWDDED